MAPLWSMVRNKSLGQWMAIYRRAQSNGEDGGKCYDSVRCLSRTNVAVPSVLNACTYFR